jgi:hypothetical protein
LLQDQGVFMNRFSIRFSILSTLLIGAGCTDEPSLADERPMGEAVFALASAPYSLSAVITFDPVAGQTFSVGVSDTDPELSVPLVVGTYTVDFANWALFNGQDTLGTDQNDEDDVEFVNFVPSTFTIDEGDIQPVAVNFKVGTDAVIFDTPPPVATFTLAVEEGTCDVDCGAGEACFFVDDATVATCEETCTTSADCADMTDDCIDGGMLSICHADPDPG